MMRTLAPDYHLHVCGPPATAAAIARFEARYAAPPPGYLAVVCRSDLIDPAMLGPPLIL